MNEITIIMKQYIVTEIFSFLWRYGKWYRIWKPLRKLVRPIQKVKVEKKQHYFFLNWPKWNSKVTNQVSSIEITCSHTVHWLQPPPPNPYWRYNSRDMNERQMCWFTLVVCSCISLKSDVSSITFSMLANIKKIYSTILYLTQVIQFLFYEWKIPRLPSHIIKLSKKFVPITACNQSTKDA